MHLYEFFLLLKHVGALIFKRFENIVLFSRQNGADSKIKCGLWTLQKCLIKNIKRKICVRIPLKHWTRKSPIHLFDFDTSIWIQSVSINPLADGQLRKGIYAYRGEPRAHIIENVRTTNLHIQNKRTILMSVCYTDV